jgi:hypothetical protein
LTVPSSRTFQQIARELGASASERDVSHTELLASLQEMVEALQ